MAKGQENVFFWPWFILVKTILWLTVKFCFNALSTVNSTRRFAKPMLIMKCKFMWSKQLFNNCGYSLNLWYRWFGHFSVEYLGFIFLGKSDNSKLQELSFTYYALLKRSHALITEFSSSDFDITSFYEDSNLSFLWKWSWDYFRNNFKMFDELSHHMNEWTFSCKILRKLRPCCWLFSNSVPQKILHTLQHIGGK